MRRAWVLSLALVGCSGARVPDAGLDAGHPDAGSSDSGPGDWPRRPVPPRDGGLPRSGSLAGTSDVPWQGLGSFNTSLLPGRLPPPVREGHQALVETSAGCQLEVEAMLEDPSEASRSSLILGRKDQRWSESFTGKRYAPQAPGRWIIKTRSCEELLDAPFAVEVSNTKSRVRFQTRHQAVRSGGHPLELRGTYSEEPLRPVAPLLRASCSPLRVSSAAGLFESDAGVFISDGDQLVRLPNDVQWGDVLASEDGAVLYLDRAHNIRALRALCSVRDFERDPVRWWRPCVNPRLVAVRPGAPLDAHCGDFGVREGRHGTAMVPNELRGQILMIGDSELRWIQLSELVAPARLRLTVEYSITSGERGVVGRLVVPWPELLGASLDEAGLLTIDASTGERKHYDFDGGVTLLGVGLEGASRARLIGTIAGPLRP